MSILVIFVNILRLSMYLNKFNPKRSSVMLPLRGNVITAMLQLYSSYAGIVF